jgi:hypothetical protein
MKYVLHCHILIMHLVTINYVPTSAANTSSTFDLIHASFSLFILSSSYNKSTINVIAI